MKRKMISLLMIIMLLGSAALADTYAGERYTIDLPEGCTAVPNGDAMQFSWETCSLIIHDLNIPNEKDAATFLETEMDVFKSAFSAGMEIVESVIVTIGENEFIRCHILRQGRDCWQYLYLTDTIYTFTTNADTETAEAILATFRYIPSPEVPAAAE